MATQNPTCPNCDGLTYIFFLHKETETFRCINCLPAAVTADSAQDLA